METGLHPLVLAEKGKALSKLGRTAELVALQELAGRSFPNRPGLGGALRRAAKDALLQPESRACYGRLLAQGWTDALRAQFPDEPVYTFWDYFRQHWQKNSGLRIDHLLLSPDLAPCLQAAGVDRWVRGQEHASDHAPTWVSLAREAD